MILFNSGTILQCISVINYNAIYVRFLIFSVVLLRFLLLSPDNSSSQWFCLLMYSLRTSSTIMKRNGLSVEPWGEVELSPLAVLSLSLSLHTLYSFLPYASFPLFSPVSLAHKIPRYSVISLLQYFGVHF